MANDPGFEGTLQKAFDRELSRRPIPLLGIGSDLAMMEALNDYGRPFHQRASEMVVPPLTPADVADMLDVAPAEALDAYLVTGGLPLILDEWPDGADLDTYLADAVRDPVSALLVSAERALAAECPDGAQVRRVLTAIGSGERTFSLIGRAAGGLQHGSLNRALWCSTGSVPPGRVGGDARSNRWSASRCAVCRRPCSPRAPRCSAVTGPAATTRRSTSSLRTGSRSRSG